MARFCTQCGKPLAEGIAFCTECGAKAETPAAPKSAPAAPQSAPVIPQSAPAAPQRPYTPPQPNYAPPQSGYAAPVPVRSAPAAEENVVSTGAFFGMMLLFALPVIGWIVCIIMAFAPKNKNLKHFARANLIWLVIALVLSLLLGILVSSLIGSVSDYTQQFLPQSGQSNVAEPDGSAGQDSSADELAALLEMLEQLGQLEGTPDN